MERADLVPWMQKELTPHAKKSFVSTGQARVMRGGDTEPTSIRCAWFWLTNVCTARKQPNACSLRHGPEKTSNQTRSICTYLAWIPRVDLASWRLGAMQLVGKTTKQALSLREPA